MFELLLKIKLCIPVSSLTLNIAKEPVKVFYMSVCVHAHIYMCVYVYGKLFLYTYIYTLYKKGGNCKTLLKAYIQLCMDF